MMLYSTHADDDPSRLRARAELLQSDLRREAPALQRVLEPPTRRGMTLLLVLAAGLVVGASTNAFGPSHHVRVLAFPLGTILGWNLVAYATFVFRAIRMRGARPTHSRLAILGRWLEGLAPVLLARRVGASARSVVVADAVQRVQRLWLPTAAPLVAARVRMLLASSVILLFALFD